MTNYGTYRIAMPADPAKLDLELIHDGCGQLVCDIHHDDEIAVLMRTADAHDAECPHAHRNDRTPKVDVGQLREQAIGAVANLGPTFLAYGADVGPVVDAVLGVFDQSVADAFAEQQFAEAKIRSMGVENGTFTLDIEPARETAKALIAAARTMIGDATNYTETKVSYGVGPTAERYTFVVQRVAPGALTPHDARLAAEQRLAEASAARLVQDGQLDRVRNLAAQLDDRGDPAAAMIRQALEVPDDEGTRP